MDESTTSIPVTCPLCGTRHFTDVHTAVLDLAMSKWNNLRLHGRCHEVSWDASAEEVEQIRSFLRDRGSQATG